MLARCLRTSAKRVLQTTRVPTTVRSSTVTVTEPIHDAPHKPIDNASRLELAHINTLLFSLHRYMTSAKDRHSETAIVDYIRHKLSKPDLHTSSRPAAFDSIILCLLQNRRFGAACRIYDEMCAEGILPSPKTRVKLLGISAVCSADNDDDLLQSLKPVFSHEAYDESSLRELLDLLSFHVSPDLIDRVFNCYIESRGDGYTPSSKLTGAMVDIQIRGGLVSSAKALLDAHANNLVKERDHQHNTEAPYPYIAMLKALRSFQDPDPEAIQNILLRMQQDTVVPDTGLLNALITTEVSMTNYHKAFNLYNVLKTSPEELNISPDAFTFASLFKALERVDTKSRKWRRLAHRMTPRRLYREMLTYHLIETRGKTGLRSSVVTPSVLAVALRTFMVRRDYPAAFVVLRSHVTHRQQPTLNTYRAVIRNLALHIRRDLKRVDSVHQKGSSLATLVGDITTLKDSLDTSLTNANLFERLLALCGGQSSIQSGHMEDPQEDVMTSSKDAPPPDSPSRKSYRIPTVAMLTGEDYVSPDATFRVAPLQRILRIAIKADLERFTPVQSVSVDANQDPAFQETRGLPASQITSQILADTKCALLPEMTPELDAKIRKLGKRQPLDKRKVSSRSPKFLRGTKTYSLYDPPLPLPSIMKFTESCA